MTKYEEYCARKRQQYGARFVPPPTPEFVRYFNTGERVRVRFGYASEPEELTGTIGITTGWRPVFLLMRTTRSLGSPWTLSIRDHVVAVKRGHRYMEVRS
jgi:hypothetical protein